MGIDQFYTRPEVAAECIRLLCEHCITDGCTFLEPSAGAGSFSSVLKKCVAVDVEPKGPNMLRADFLALSAADLSLPERSKVIAVGNPPFGQGGGNGYALAVRFINHAAQFADVVAFILPAAFSRLSLQVRVDPSLHLIRSFAVSPSSFQPSVRVDCVFQIWQRRSDLRDVAALKQRIALSSRATFFVPFQEANAAIVRAGHQTGLVKALSPGLSPESHYFLKLDDAKSFIVGTYIARPLGRFRSMNKLEIVEAIQTWTA